MYFNGMLSKERRRRSRRRRRQVEGKEVGAKNRLKGPRKGGRRRRRRPRRSKRNESVCADGGKDSEVKLLFAVATTKAVQVHREKKKKMEGESTMQYLAERHPQCTFSFSHSFLLFFLPFSFSFPFSCDSVRSVPFSFLFPSPLLRMVVVTQSVKNCNCNTQLQDQ